MLDIYTDTKPLLKLLSNLQDKQDTLNRKELSLEKELLTIRKYEESKQHLTKALPKKSIDITKELFELQILSNKVFFNIQKIKISLELLRLCSYFNVFSVGYTKTLLDNGSVIVTPVAQIVSKEQASIYRYLFNVTELPIYTNLDSTLDDVEKGFYGYSAENTFNSKPTLEEFVDFKRHCFENIKSSFNYEQQPNEFKDKFQEISNKELEILEQVTSECFNTTLTGLISDYVLADNIFRQHNSNMSGHLKAYVPFSI